jgi:hypothetical protein
MLGVASDEVVEDMLGERRLIGLRDSAGRLRFPRFQALDGRPLEPLVAAFWEIADGAISEWTAASWCAAPSDALDGMPPAQWVRDARDPVFLQRVDGRTLPASRSEATALQDRPPASRMNDHG